MERTGLQFKENVYLSTGKGKYIRCVLNHFTSKNVIQFFKGQ